MIPTMARSSNQDGVADGAFMDLAFPAARQRLVHRVLREVRSRCRGPKALERANRSLAPPTCPGGVDPGPIKALCLTEASFTRGLT